MENIIKAVRENDHLFTLWANYFVYCSDGTYFEFEYKPHTCTNGGDAWLSVGGKCKQLKEEVVNTIEGHILDAPLNWSNWKEIIIPIADDGRLNVNAICECGIEHHMYRRITPICECTKSV